MNFGFIIDNRKCIGCHACTVACKAEHDVPLGVNRTWVKYVEKGEFPHTRRLFSVMRCNHCADAPCVEICPVTALYTRDDGIVDFDHRRCIGCKACMQACPYDALYLDPDTHTAAKCNYCAHRVDIGLEPACVNVCPEHAIISGDIDNPLTEISQLLAREQVTARKVEKGTRPKLFYIEGDQASLQPIATDPSPAYMWSSQATGVGHFAKYAEQRISENGLRAQGPENDKDLSKVVVPGGGGGDPQKMVVKADEVEKENARRVYDVPDKGTLWGWEVSLYIWTKAISTGAFLVPFLAINFGWTPVTDKIQGFSQACALLFLTLTGALLIKDLDKPARFLYILFRPQWRSWLVRGSYAILLYGAFLVLWTGAHFLNVSRLLAFALWGCATFAIVTTVYTAFLFAQAKGRDFWQSPTLSLHMLVHAIMAGAAVFAIIGLFLQFSESWSHYLRLVIYSSIAVNVSTLMIEILTAHPTADSKRTITMILAGPFRLIFWAGCLVLGNLIPLILVWMGGAALLGLTGIFILVGIYLIEHIWVRAPQLIPLS